MTDLRHFDLNLLTAFEALMTERTVTRAAHRIGIGQPAMSYALSRLRALFGDKLFVRSAGAMLPTTRALDLAEPIARILADVRETVLAGRAFRPAAEDRVFRIGSSDQVEVAILPRIIAPLRAAAPAARVAVTDVDRDRVSSMLESGIIDLALGFFPDPARVERHEILFHEEFVCLFDAEACGIAAPIALDAYLELPQLLMSLRPEMVGAIDGLLAGEGRQRFVLMSTPHFLAIPFLLRGLRAVAAVPRRLAEHCAEVANLAVSPLPIPLEGYDVSMLWHTRTDTDPAQRWFRDLVRGVKRHGHGGPAQMEGVRTVSSPIAPRPGIKA